VKYIVITLLLSSNAFAAEYKQFYLVNGKEVAAETAILASLKGGEAYRCVSVESKVSKSGTSIGIRNVKKPRSSQN
jgi:hypothetical protein